MTTIKAITILLFVIEGILSSVLPHHFADPFLPVSAPPVLPPPGFLLPQHTIYNQPNFLPPAFNTAIIPPSLPGLPPLSPPLLHTHAHVLPPPPLVHAHAHVLPHHLPAPVIPAQPILPSPLLPSHPIFHTIPTLTGPQAFPIASGLPHIAPIPFIPTPPIIPSFKTYTPGTLLKTHTHTVVYPGQITKSIVPIYRGDHLHLTHHNHNHLFGK